MFRLIFFVVALCFLLASAATADIAPPKHQKEIDPRVRFQGIEENADHIFFLWFYSSGGDPHGTAPRLIEIRNAEAFHLYAQSRIYGFAVLAMPRKDFDKRKAGDPSLSWLAGKPMGNDRTLSWLKYLPEVQYAFIQKPSMRASAYDDETPVTEYRVILSAGKLAVEVVAMPVPPGEPPVLRRWPIWVAGAIIAVTLTGLGAWFVRRRWLNSKAQTLAQKESPPGRFDYLV